MPPDQGPRDPSVNWYTIAETEAYMASRAAAGWPGSEGIHPSGKRRKPKPKAA